MTEKMKAVRYHQYGGPEVLVMEHVQKPVVGPGQVLVKVKAAGINPIDWKLRAGEMTAIIPVQFPVTVGRDLAGVVEAVAEDVESFRPGDAVYAVMPKEAFGAYAEYALLDQSHVALKPETLDFIQASTIPMSALTAWQSIVDIGELKAGDNILVHGAAGSVGSMAVQIAKALGAQVTGAAFEKDKAFVESLGTDRFVSYDAGPFENVVQDQDIVLDTLAGEIQDRSWSTLKPNGILVTTLVLGDQEKPKQFGVRAANTVSGPSGAQLKQIAQLIDSGKISTRLGLVLSLDEAAKAQELSQSHSIKGKIVLNLQ
ncbi:MAG: NADP-dependent oxidoreductase [Hymenobacter sp.]